MRVTFLLLVALCVYLSEVHGYKDRDSSDESNEKWDKGHKKDKYKKYDKHEKYDKHGKQDKYNKKNDKYEKKKWDRDDSDESNEDFDDRFSPKSVDRFDNDRFYEKELKHYKYNKYYDDDSREYGKGKKNNKNHKKGKRDDRHFDIEPDSGFFDEAIQFSKRRLFSVPEDEEDSFFDDVKHYNQRNLRNQPAPYQPAREQQQRYNRNNQQRQWQEPERYEYRNAERYPGGEGNFQEQGPSTRYNWKQDTENFPRMSPLSIPPPEKTFRVEFGVSDDPPAPSEAAKMARYIVHNADWTTVATISTLSHIRNYPFVNVLSVSDGPVENGSGIPYLYMTELDMTPHDLAVNRKCSLSMTLAETDYCKQQSLDPEDPRCAHLTLTGEMWKLRNGTQSAQLAEEALFSRHPVMKTWPKNHNFFFATLKIEQIVLLDYFGGPKYVDVKEYLRATPST